MDLETVGRQKRVGLADLRSLQAYENTRTTTEQLQSNTVNITGHKGRHSTSINGQFLPGKHRESHLAPIKMGAPSVSLATKQEPVGLGMGQSK